MDSGRASGVRVCHTVAPPTKICENLTRYYMDGEEREIDYLICQECHTPCYTFEGAGERIVEAECLVCGNDDVSRFVFGESEQE